MSVPTFAPRNKSIYLTTSNAGGKVLSYDGNFGSSSNLKMSPPSLSSNQRWSFNDDTNTSCFRGQGGNVFFDPQPPNCSNDNTCPSINGNNDYFWVVIHRMNRIVMIRIPVSGDIGVMTVLV